MTDKLIDSTFVMNNRTYRVWDVYGVDTLTSQTIYQCRAFDGSGTIYLAREDIVPHIVQQEEC